MCALKFSFDKALPLYAAISFSVDLVCYLHVPLINKQETNREVNGKTNAVTMPIINCCWLSISFCLLVSTIIPVGTKHIQKFTKTTKAMVKHQLFKLKVWILELRHLKCWKNY